MRKILEITEMILQLLHDAKPEDDCELARQYAAVIAEYEKMLVRFETYIIK